MGMTDRLLSRCGEPNQDNTKVCLDPGAFFRNLLLFDTFVLDSIRLLEFSEISKIIGYGQLRTLLDSGALKIEVDALTIGQTGQCTVLSSREKKGALPLGSYSFSVVNVPDRKSYISDCLKNIDAVGIASLKEKIKLKRTIVDKIEEPKEDIAKPTIQQLLFDIRLNSPNIITAVKVHLKKEFSISEVPDHLFIKMHQIDEEDFKSETNIGFIFNFDEMTVHKVIERALLSVAGLNQRIAEMKAFSALSGFQIDDIPLFSEKLDFIGQQFCPAAKEKQMKRVIELAGFPDFSKIGEDYTLDLDKFLKIRESDECKQFRKWLSESPSLTDKEVEEFFGSIRTKIGSALGGTFGKSLRFLVSTGIGSLDGGAISGSVIGAIDTFILDKLFPASGVVSFVNRLYPSIFKVN